MVEEGDHARLRVGFKPGCCFADVELREADVRELRAARRELGEAGDGGAAHVPQVVPASPLPDVEVVKLRPGVANLHEVVVGHRKRRFVGEEVERREVRHLRQELLDEVREGGGGGAERCAEGGAVVGNRVGDVSRDGGEWSLERVDAERVDEVQREPFESR